MDDAGRAIRQALVPIVASLAPWGVVDARWLPHENPRPTIWLRTRTEIERVALQAQPWPIAQVRIMLTRLSVPYDVVSALQLDVTSLEGEEGA
jgi:hypothetical protein